MEKDFKHHSALVEFIRRPEVEYFSAVWPDRLKQKKGAK